MEPKLNSQDQDPKIKYNNMMAQVKELKENQKKNESKHKQLNDDLNNYSKLNSDLTMKIKIIENELDGSDPTEIIASFENQIKLKQERIAELRIKKNDQLENFKKKSNQNDSILNKLKNTLKEKQSNLAERQSEYQKTIHQTTQINQFIEKHVANQNKRREETKKIVQLQQILTKLQQKIRTQECLFSQKKKELEKQQQNIQITNHKKQIQMLEKQIRQLQSQRNIKVLNQSKQITELEQQLSKLKQLQFENLNLTINVKHQQKKRLLQDIESLQKQITQKQLEYHQNSVHIESLNFKIRESANDIKKNKQLKEQLEKSNKELARLNKEQVIHKGKVVANQLKINNVQNQIKMLQKKQVDIQQQIDFAKEQNEILRKQNSDLNHQINELKVKISKGDSREYENLKRIKQNLQKQIIRQKQRYQSLKQLQKSYYPQSALKEYKKQYDELKQKSINLNLIISNHKKTKEEYAFLRKKIEELKKQEQDKIQQLKQKNSELDQKLTEVSNTNKENIKIFNQLTKNLNHYVKAYPQHENEKLIKKQEQKLMQQEISKQKKIQQQNAKKQRQQLIRINKKLKKPQVKQVKDHESNQESEKVEVNQQQGTDQLIYPNLIGYGIVLVLFAILAYFFFM